MGFALEGAFLASRSISPPFSPFLVSLARFFCLRSKVLLACASLATGFFLGGLFEFAVQAAQGSGLMIFSGLGKLMHLAGLLGKLIINGRIWHMAHGPLSVIKPLQ